MTPVPGDGDTPVADGPDGRRTGSDLRKRGWRGPDQNDPLV